MGEGRSESNTKLLFYCLNSEEKQAQIQQVNMDMWKPYINTIEEIAPQAKIVHDKFHLFQKLSEAIDKTRKKELKELEDKSLLLKQKYTVLKNAETRTQHQQLAFEAIDKANLRTAQAWHIRENFKTIFNSGTIPEIVSNYHQWIENSLASGLEEIIKVVHTFERHRQGILNAIITQSSSGKHENLNGKIQALLAKARGFQNFDRFRINVLFYFANLSF
jgi:transposase